MEQDDANPSEILVATVMFFRNPKVWFRHYLQNKLSLKRRFPFARMEFGRGSFRSSIHWNPYVDLPPTHSYSFQFEVPPIDLGADAAFPDVETVLTTNFEIESVEFPESRSWRTIQGAYSWYRIERCSDSSIWNSVPSKC